MKFSSNLIRLSCEPLSLWGGLSVPTNSGLVRLHDTPLQQCSGLCQKQNPSLGTDVKNAQGWLQCISGPGWCILRAVIIEETFHPKTPEFRGGGGGYVSKLFCCS